MFELPGSAWWAQETTTPARQSPAQKLTDEQYSRLTYTEKKEYAARSSGQDAPTVDDLWRRRPDLIAQRDDRGTYFLDRRTGEPIE